MSNLTKMLLISLLAAASVPLTAQVEQHTTVTKTLVNNPSIGIIDFIGDPAVRENLERVLDICGWFNVKRGAEAKSAVVRVSASVAPDGAIVTSVNAGNMTFKTRQPAASGNIPVYATVDDILRNIFKIKALCMQKIYFVQNGKNNLKEIFSCYIDGSGHERVTHNNSISTEPGWGHRNSMVYTLAMGNALSIVLADMGTGRQRVVSKMPGLNASAGLSHDGRRLALPLSVDNQVDLYVLELDKGGRRVRLTKDRNVESSPCWSPDGAQLCYVSDKLGVPQLYLRSSQPGGSEKRISTGNNECVSPDWSNISNKLCFSMKNNVGQRVIAVVDMGDPNFSIRIVTPAAGNWEAPSWGPDGRRIVCTRSSARGGSRDLYLVDSMSNDFRQITKGAMLSLPAWRPAY